MTFRSKLLLKLFFPPPINQSFSFDAEFDPESFSPVAYIGSDTPIKFGATSSSVQTVPAAYALISDSWRILPFGNIADSTQFVECSVQWYYYPETEPDVFGPAVPLISPSFTPVNPPQEILTRIDSNPGFLNTPGYKRVFLRFSYTYPSRPDTTPPDGMDSQWFTILSSCQKMIGTDYTKIDSFIDKCPATASACQQETGECLYVAPPQCDSTTCNQPFHSCQPGSNLCQISPETPSPSTCPSCIVQNTATCDLTNPLTHPCNCRGGFVGLTCAEPTECTPTISKSQCDPARGYLTTRPGDGCDTECICYNEWAGKRCQSCFLRCDNEGIPYKDCARCGCREGFTGPKCTWQSVKGTITITATNDVIIQTAGKLSNTPATTTPFQIDKSSFQTSPLTKTPTQSDIQLYTIMRDVFSDIQQGLLADPTNGELSLMIEPITSIDSDTPSRTAFHFTIPFGCPQYNNNISSKDEIESKWTPFVRSFVKLTTIQKYFFAKEFDIASSILTPTPPTLPPDGEELVNGSYGVPTSTIYFIAFIALIMTPV